MLKRIKAIRLVMIAVMTLTLFGVPSARGAIVNIEQKFPATTFTTSATHAGVLIQNTTTESMTLSITGVTIPGVATNVAGFWGFDSDLALGEDIVENAFLAGEAFSFTLLAFQAVSIYGEIPDPGIFVTLPEGDLPGAITASGIKIIGDQYKGGIGFFANGAGQDVPFLMEGTISVPEPSSSLLLIFGMFVGIMCRRR